jgi:hypothetical protein
VKWLANSEKLSAEDVNLANHGLFELINIQAGTWKNVENHRNIKLVAGPDGI